MRLTDMAIKPAQNVIITACTGSEKRKTAQKYKGKYCNFAPKKADLQKENAIEKYILHGWLPEKPFITKDSNILTFGSCFAEHIYEYLMKKGYTGSINQANGGSCVIRVCATMVNTYAVRQHFEWAYEGRKFPEILWSGSENHRERCNNEMSEEIRMIYEHADVFIITLGLSEVWCNNKTGEVFWHAIPKDKFNPEVHGFRITTVEENLENINKIYAIIRNNRPTASIIFTLSPVPLHATFRPVSCITANSVSKAILRAAVDEALRKNSADNNLFYWPSYEIVTEYYNDPYEDNRHHVKANIVYDIMEHFTRYYCIPEKSYSKKTINREFISQFIGKYRLNADNNFQIEIGINDNNILLANIPGLPLLELTLFNGTTFLVNGDRNTFVEFYKEIIMDKSLMAATFSLPNGVWHARRFE